MENNLSERELKQVVGGSGTGAGMAEWAWHAYEEQWSYVWGGAAPSGVDTSGLIFSYAGGARSSEAMFAAASEKGVISTLPEQPGIGVYMYGHVGVYVGHGTVISAENEAVGITARPVSAGGWSTGSGSPA